MLPRGAVANLAPRQFAAILAEARSLLEARYLDGHAALFADATAEWAVLRDQVERLASIATSIPSATSSPSATILGASAP